MHRTQRGIVIEYKSSYGIDYRSDFSYSRFSTHILLITIRHEIGELLFFATELWLMDPQSLTMANSGLLIYLKTERMLVLWIWFIRNALLTPNIVMKDVI
ncbi:MAG: hypothetical protein EAX81_07470 [Candidatus Thorarchaeota archaeon]|nr:hypothetical protein [Candidatus Thorarchaeota archaeon]